MNIEEVKEWVNNEVYGRREFTLLALQKLDDSVEWLITEHDRLTQELAEAKAEIARLSGCAEGYRKSAETWSNLFETTESRVRQECAEMLRKRVEVMKSTPTVPAHYLDWMDGHLSEVAEAILHGQQGQKVCEWDKLPPQMGGGYGTCMEVAKDSPKPGESCPYCGLPIKIKEAP